MNIDLGGRVALVTGGASGIGEACARTLAAAGAQVVIADRRHEPAQLVANDIGCRAVELDIAQEKMVRSVVAEVESRDGPIRILVNCAGVLQNTDPPEALRMEVWDRVTNVHLRGTYLLTVAVGLRMSERRNGSIVTIASVAGMRSAPLHAYSPAKAGLISLTECLAAEWGPTQVRVNAVSPGFVRTTGVSRGIAEGIMSEKLMSEYSAFGRMVEPSEIANTVLFLASDFASAITGINLPVDAGFLVATNWAAYGGVRRDHKSF